MTPAKELSFSWDDCLAARVEIYASKLLAPRCIWRRTSLPVQSIRHFMYIPRCHPGKQGFVGQTLAWLLQRGGHSNTQSQSRGSKLKRTRVFLRWIQRIGKTKNSMIYPPQVTQLINRHLEDSLATLLESHAEFSRDQNACFVPACFWRDRRLPLDSGTPVKDSAL